MNIQLENYKQPASQRVIVAMSGTVFDENAIKIILFATEGGVGCKKTAEGIARVIEKAHDKNNAMLEIIANELCMNEYFFPNTEIKNLINSLSNCSSPTTQ